MTESEYVYSVAYTFAQGHAVELQSYLSDGRPFCCTLVTFCRRQDLLVTVDVYLGMGTHFAKDSSNWFTSSVIIKSLLHELDHRQRDRFLPDNRSMAKW